jgi:hypothetical protein
LRIINVDFSPEDQLIPYKCCIIQKLVNKFEQNEAVHQLFIDFNSAYDSVRREVIDNNLVEFGLPKELERQKYV